MLKNTTDFKSREVFFPVYSTASSKSIRSPCSVLDQDLAVAKKKNNLSEELENQIIRIAVEIYQTVPEQISRFSPEIGIISCVSMRSTQQRQRFFSPQFKKLENDFSEKIDTLKIKKIKKQAVVRAFSETLRENVYAPQKDSTLLHVFISKVDCLINDIKEARRIRKEEHTKEMDESRGCSK
jgi:hypothetical protein